MSSKLPAEAIAFFKKAGKQGGQKAAAAMTPEERTARAAKASLKAAEVRTKKAAAKKAAAKKVAGATKAPTKK